MLRYTTQYQSPSWLSQYNGTYINKNIKIWGTLKVDKIAYQNIFAENEKETLAHERLYDH